ncbi:MAG TPA: Cof-type HAD-IIB family hydrolase, partial [Candidatus Acidoferrales bacterium]|nr:Cof-type HAD-IIB family hydrolase [Candidatus Acidoferrales bacterium]
ASSACTERRALAAQGTIDSMGIRLIGIDIDGTLLNSKWQLPEANRKAIGEATARGIEVVLVTGRRFDFAMPIARQLGSPLTLIVNNGALIKSQDGATHLRHLLPRDTAHKVLQATLPFRDGAAVMFDRPKENQVIWEVLDWKDPVRAGYLQRNMEFIAQVAPLENCLSEDPIQVMFTGPVDRMRSLESQLRGWPQPEAFALAYTEYELRNFALVDVINRACSKGAALQEWARVRGFPREEVMAIGDNHNDREMLEFAGVPIVMGNSVAELLKNGWHVTLSNDESGVAAAIEQFAFDRK